MNELSDIVDLPALATWMDGKGLGSGPIEQVRPLTGGTQNILLRFRRHHSEYVLRRPPKHPRPGSNETMRREARVLGALAGTGVPHPRLIAACTDEGCLGVAFYLMEPVEGFNATVGMPQLHAADPNIRLAMGFSAVDSAAALGAVDYKGAGLADLGKTDNFLERQVDRWRGQLEGYSAYARWPGVRDIPHVDEVARWLVDNRPRAWTPGIMHGDYHLANLMFRLDGPQVAAIVDWELTTIGDPLIDLGWLLATWPDADGSAGVLQVTPWEGFPDRAQITGRYAVMSRRSLDAVGWYAVFACYKLGILLEGTYARACAGEASVDTGSRLHTLTISLLRRALRWTVQPPR